MAERYPAKINGFPLECETIDDTFTKAIIEHEIPYKDGALLEDMGLKARQLKLRCYFLNDNYETHYRFLDSLKNNVSLSYISHPVYGIITGKIKHVVVRHDDSIDCATVDIDFVQELSADIKAKVQGDPRGDAAEAYKATIDEMQGEFADDSEAAFGADGRSLMQKAIAAQGKIADQVSGLTAPLRAFVNNIDNCIQLFEGTVAGITAPAYSLVNTVSFAASIPGRVSSSVMNLMEAKAVLFDTLKDSPSRLMDAFKTASGEITDALDDLLDEGDPLLAMMKKQVAAAASMTAAVHLAEIYGADEDNRGELEQAEQEPGFNDNGELIRGEPLPDVLTITEIEQSLADARGMLQSAIDMGRGMPSLKKTALALLDHVGNIKLQYDRIVTVDVEQEAHLFLVLFRYGLPYTAAERVMKINPQIKNPNFVMGAVRLYVR